MSSRSPIRRDVFGSAALVLALATLAGCDAAGDPPSSRSSGRSSVTPTQTAEKSRVKRPALDAEAPAKFETATFALG